jgi:hypothetical protein
MKSPPRFLIRSPTPTTNRPLAMEKINGTTAHQGAPARIYPTISIVYEIARSAEPAMM